MFTYLTMIFNAFRVFSHELTNQLNRFKKSTRANSRSSAIRKAESYADMKIYFLGGAGLL